MTKKRGMLAEDLYHLKSVHSPELSPDGNRVLYVETVINKEKEEYNSHLYIGDLKEKKLAQWTFGEVKDSSPHWSPDGKAIVFVSNRSGKSQLYMMSTEGGEPRQLTYCRNGARTAIWSPDGTKILFVTSLAPDEKVEDKEEEEKKDDKKVEPMIIDRLRYKSDAVGFLDEKSQHLAVIDVKTGDVEQLTEGERNYTPGCWSPDGKNITFSADLTDEPDHSLLMDAYTMSLTGEKKLTKLTNSNGSFGNTSWSPDGRFIALIGHEREFENATLSKIWLYDVQANQLRCMTAEWDVQIGDFAIGDFHSGYTNPGVCWTNDGKGFYFLMSDHGNTGVYYGSIEGEMYPSLLENQHVYGLTIDPEHHKAVVAISTSTHPGDLYVLDLSMGDIQQLTFVNDEFLREIELSVAEPITFKAPDNWDIHGWVMRPIGFKEGIKYPTIVEIHGGPHAMYANTYFHEFQTLTAQGYVVVFTNPRGSHGYGQHFVDAVRGDYGGKDYLDVIAATDYVVNKHNFVDEMNLGITGGSYGGFMTNWVVGHTNRFKAAVTQRSISNWLSFYGVSDIGYYFSEWQLKGNPMSDPDKLWEQSPLRYVGNVETPLLILHGEKDFRCPIEQAEQLFVALKKQKKTTKFIRFPGANHELSRSGHPSLRIARLNYIKEWFVEYLD